jgi:hypothetical protein
LVDLGAEILRDMWASCWYKKFHREWDSADGAQFLSDETRLKGFRANFGEQVSLLERGDIRDFDISILCGILQFSKTIRNYPNVNPFFFHDVSVVLKCRNDIDGHKASTSLPTALFKRWVPDNILASGPANLLTTYSSLIKYTRNFDAGRLQQAISGILDCAVVDQAAIDALKRNLLGQAEVAMRCVCNCCNYFKFIFL